VVERQHLQPSWALHSRQQRRNTADHPLADVNTVHVNTVHVNTGHVNTGYVNTGYVNTGHDSAGYDSAGHDGAIIDDDGAPDSEWIAARSRTGSGSARLAVC
jgi:hypothetical protein